MIHPIWGVLLFFFYFFYLLSCIRRRGEFPKTSKETVDYCIKCGDFHHIDRICNPITKLLNDIENESENQRKL